MYLNHAKGWVRDRANFVYEKAAYLCDHHTYTIPIALGFCSIASVVYLFCATVVAMSNMNDTIRSIPTVVQLEMKKTRIVMQQEGISNRDMISGQHITTREELAITKQEIQDRMVQAEKERVANKKILDAINEKLVEAQSKRQKILGLF